MRSLLFAVLCCVRLWSTERVLCILMQAHISFAFVCCRYCFFDPPSVVVDLALEGLLIDWEQRIPVGVQALCSGNIMKAERLVVLLRVSCFCSEEHC